MRFTAEEIAHYLDGTVHGDKAVTVSSVARIEQGKPGTICFLANPKYTSYFYKTKASIVLINNDFEIDTTQPPVQATLIRVPNAYEAVSQVLGLFTQRKTRRGVSLRACRSWSARLGRGVWVGAHAYIGRHAKIARHVQIYPHVYVGENVQIGEGTILYPGVKIYQGCIIGAHCIIHANAVIGSDGFGFAPTESGSYRKIPQTGTVTIEDNVEIGANTVVDRATMGTTLIRKGVKLDNLVQIAHNVEIGENTVMAAQTGVAGSAKIGSGCMMGGQVGVAGHLTVANGTQCCAQTGIIGNITKENTVLMGMPAIEHREYMKAYALFKRAAKK